jgi:hypothetical protein
MISDRESVKVLQECIELQAKKSRDYQNPNSNVVQAMHYRRGVDSIHDVLHAKMLRAQSLLETGSTPNFESLEDTYKDMINYASFAVSYLRGKMEGQDPDRDMFNRAKSLPMNYRYEDMAQEEPKDRQAEISVAALACGLDPNDQSVRTYVDGKLKQ